MPKRKVPKELSEYFSAIGRRGGRKGGAARVRHPQRRELARRAALARWSKKKAGPS